VPQLNSPVWLAKVGVPSRWPVRRDGTALFPSVATTLSHHKDIRHTKAEKELGYPAGR
jgi:hypothetical protein